jgi:hypothetical protein
MLLVVKLRKISEVQNTIDVHLHLIYPIYIINADENRFVLLYE